MELQFLGTSSGTPTKNRNVSGLALRPAQTGHWYLVDCGEGTQHQVLHTSLSLCSLRAVFITHLHGDHCYGLPGLLASAGMLNRTEPLLIAAPASVRRFVEGVLDTTELRLPYPIEFLLVDDAPSIGSLPDVAVQVTPLSHRVPSYAFSFTEKGVGNKLDAARLQADGVPSGPLRGQLQRGEQVRLADGRVLQGSDYLLPPRKPRKIIVAGDNDRPELLGWAARGADVLVHEATYTEEILQKIGPGPQHSSARMVAQFASEAQIPNLVLTHFSARYQEGGDGLSLADVEAEARASYAGKLFLASDLARFGLDTHGQLSRVP
jgi:ribonuclease Z